MWPFSKISQLQEQVQVLSDANVSLRNMLRLKADSLEWQSLSKTPPTQTNLLVANKDFTYFGFLYLQDGINYSQKINMYCQDKLWTTYTNPESITYWLNLDLIKRATDEK